MIRPDAAIDQVRQYKRLLKWSKVIVGVGLLLVAVVVIQAVALAVFVGGQVEESTKKTQDSVAQSVTTKVEMDTMGLSHLMDKSTGNQVTIRANGDAFPTSRKFDALTSRKLDCLPINHVAKMVNDLASGTSGSLVIRDEYGIEREIISFSGNYKDDSRILHFAGFKVILDSNSCEESISNPLGGLDITEAMEAYLNGTYKDDENGEGGGVEASNEDKQRAIFNRALTPSSDSWAVLARHRQELVDARSALREGRHLQVDSSEVEVVSSSEVDSSTTTVSFDIPAAA
jgi:hypothetical protein